MIGDITNLRARKIFFASGISWIAKQALKSNDMSKLVSHFGVPLMPACMMKKTLRHPVNQKSEQRQEARSCNILLHQKPLNGKAARTNLFFVLAYLR